MNCNRSTAFHEFFFFLWETFYKLIVKKKGAKKKNCRGYGSRLKKWTLKKNPTRIHHYHCHIIIRVKGKKKRLLLCSLLLNIWKIETKCKLIFFFLGWLKVRFFMKVWDFGRVKDDKRDKMEDPFTRSRWVFSSIVVLVWGSAGTPLASFSWKFKESKKIKGTTGHYHHYHSNQQ